MYDTKPLPFLPFNVLEGMYTASKHTSIGPMLALYWRVPFVPATVQTVLSQYTGHTMIKVDVLAWIGPALARLYRPSIGPLVSAQHWPDTSQFQHCSARCRRGSFSWRHLGNAILPPNWDGGRHFCERFRSGICSGKLPLLIKSRSFNCGNYA